MVRIEKTICGRPKASPPAAAGAEARTKSGAIVKAEAVAYALSPGLEWGRRSSSRINGSCKENEEPLLPPLLRL